MKKTKLAVSAGLRGPALLAAFDRVAAAFPDSRVDRLDGLRVDWPDGWLLVRASNTEPIVRIVAEAGDEAAVDAAIARAAAAVAA